MNMSMGMPLTGVRVLDLTRLMPGYSTKILADLGADVIKVEEPTTGDYLRILGPRVNGTERGYCFEFLNSGKRSVGLNLKSDEGKQIFARLCETADIIVESYRPGVMGRLGLAYEDLKDKYPRLVYCSISGYGQTGPYAQLPGHDINYLAFSGAASLTGAEPTMLPIPISDLESGQRAALAIVAVLLQRERTGQGRAIDISMLDGLIAWMPQALADYLGDAHEPATMTELQPRGHRRFLGPAPGYSVYKTKDDKYLAIGAAEPRFWHALCVCIGRPDIEDNRFFTTAEVDAELRGTFLTRCRAEWLKDLYDADVPASPVNTVSEMIDDPQVRARGMLVTRNQSGVGEMTSIGDALRLGSSADAALSPELGEHTGQVLSDLGLTADHIDSLRRRGVV